ncbi:MAG: B-box zinc finger protein [Candidatus Sericytochromatia bacterium]|nr:B-box zinc finger protein [Candidatus Sericytochromatia bacterium]
MALCAYHEDTEATSTCVTCKSAICDVCKDYGADGMCGMCLEVTNARRTNMDHARAAARAATAEVRDGYAEELPEEPVAPSRRGGSAPLERPGAIGEGRPSTRELTEARSPSKPLRTPPGPAEGVNRGRGTNKLEPAAPAASAPVKRLTTTQKRQRRLYAAVAAGLLLVGAGAWLLLSREGGPGEPSEELVLELRQRMGLVKSAVLSVQERSGALPDSIVTIEAELRRRDFDPNALHPPLRIVLDRKTSWPYAVVLRTRPKGMELTATDDKGREVMVNGQPLLMDVPRRDGLVPQGSGSPAATPTPALGDVKLDD